MSDPSGHLGGIVGVIRHVDLETNSGDIIKDVNTKELSRLRSSVSGDCMVMGPGIGRVIAVVFSDGVKCEMLVSVKEL